MSLSRSWRRLDRATVSRCILTLQALSGFFFVVTLKRLVPFREAEEAVMGMRAVFPVGAGNSECLSEAMAVTAQHSRAFRGAMMVATARRAGGSLLVSEDGQDGRHVQGITLVNPFTDGPLPLLEQALGPA